MLIGFKLRNFRSFFNEQSFCFSLSTGYKHEGALLMPTGPTAIPRISKTAIVFGANASGKTNLLNGLAICRHLILHSMGFSDIEFSECYMPFLLGHGAHSSTDFAIDVVLEGRRYCYSMSYDAQRVRAERLVIYRAGTAQRWFDRRYDEATQQEEWMPFSPKFKGPRELWRKATRQTALFLTTAGRLNAEPLAPLLQWVEHGIEMMHASDSSDFSRFARHMQDQRLKTRIVDLLSAVDIPVIDVRVTDLALPPEAEGARPVGDEKTPENTRPHIEFLHERPGGSPVWLDSVSEASGTRRLVRLLTPLLAAMDLGKLLLIDEFDTGLHPLVSRFLINLINESAVANRGAQLLFTSHNATLLDLDILSHDDIWLMELDEAQSSRLTPMFRSNPCRHELLDIGYLRSRLDALRSGADDTPSVAADSTLQRRRSQL